MFQNSNSLPIALIQSLVSEVPGLKWGKDDNKDQMVGRALAYMVVYSTLGMMVSFKNSTWRAGDEKPRLNIRNIVSSASLVIWCQIIV